MQKFTIGLLSILVTSLFIASPVTASVKMVTLAPTKKSNPNKTALVKEKKVTQPISTSSNRLKNTAKATTPIKNTNKSKESLNPIKISPSVKNKTIKTTEIQSKSKAINQQKKEADKAKQATKIVNLKSIALKPNNLSSTPHGSAKKSAPVLNSSRKTPPLNTTMTIKTKEKQVPNHALLPAFTTSGLDTTKNSPTISSPTNIVIPKAPSQSADITPPISSFGKLNQKTSSSSPYVSLNARLPERKPIYINEPPNGPNTRAKAALVLDENNLKILYERNSTTRMPMASITKLMTALVVIESMQNMNEILTISEDDIDRLKGTGSRLSIGTRLTRGELLKLALMSSENRAASALGRYYPGGKTAFINAMNLKAAILGMTNTRYVDTNGLSPQNVSCARDLAKLVMAASEYPLIRQYSTTEYYTVYTNGKALNYGSTNRLTHSSSWKILLQKTGYIREAGQCLVMKTLIDNRPVVIVLLNVVGPKGARIVDARNVKNWMTHTEPSNNSRSRSFSRGDISDDTDFYD